MRILAVILCVLLIEPAQAADLPEPFATKSSTKFSKVIGWPDHKMPAAPRGFMVERFAEGFNNPRNIYVAPNGDIFVSEGATKASEIKKLGAKMIGADKAQKLGEGGNRVVLLRDSDGDGVPELKTTFIAGLKQPFGMTILNGYFYVANTDAVLRWPYQDGMTEVTGEGEKILTLPAGGYNNHWTRNLLTSADGSKIYVSVGSASNVGEHGMDEEIRRAAILEINPDGSGERIYADGLRNPVGMDIAPGTQTLWTAVNERDELGDDLVPDYLTSVQAGGFYGWPYSYWGQHVDPRLKGERPDLVARAIVPDIDLGSHTASLGLAFYDGEAFPAKYRTGAFIGQHGSWNRSEFVGYKVAFVPFANGTPSGPPEDFLTGFIADPETREVYGRPVGVAVTKDGALLVADDGANIIWRVSQTQD